MQSQKERIDMIRKAAAKFKQKQKRDRRFDLMEQPQHESEEVMWADSRRYVNDFYGDAYKHTTKLDNDWD